eukprot:7465211-Alexandrium_andersonii.AAC.1
MCIRDRACKIPSSNDCPGSGRTTTAPSAGGASTGCRTGLGWGRLPPRLLDTLSGDGDQSR